MAYKFRAKLGDRFGRWEIVEPTQIGTDIHRLKVKCRCDCGTIRDVLYNSLRSNDSVSCGCMRDENSRKPKTHGMSGHPILVSYSKMKERCNNSNFLHYHRYGGRGITISEDWKRVDKFIEDMLPSWFEEATLERIDNDGNYTKENCRWATRKEQASNRSTNIFITYNGKTQTIMDWGTELGMNRNTLYSRISRGWDVKEAIETPVNTKSFI